MKTNVLIIGCGLTGIVLAERYASSNNNIIIIDKRSHVGGNCYDEYVDGVLTHRYGAHIFHTKDKEVFNYITQFCSFNNYVHYVKSYVDNEYYNIPLDLESISKAYGKKFKNKAEFKEYIKKRYKNDRRGEINFETYISSRIGPMLYKKFFLSLHKKAMGYRAVGNRCNHS